MADSVDTLFTEYARRYTQYDAAGVAELSSVPFVAVRRDVAIHLENGAAVQAHFAEAMDSYRASGAAGAVAAAIDVRALGPHGGMATVASRVTAADGRVLKDFETTHHLLARGEGWLILSHTNHD